MRTQLVLAAAVVLSFFGVARADTYSTFNLNSTLASGTGSGTFTLDETTGKFTNSNFTYVYNSTTSFTFTGAGTQYASGTGYDIVNFSTPSSSTVTLQLVLPLGSLKGYQGGSICTPTAQCNNFDSSIQNNGTDAVDFTSGTLALATPVVVTAEPPSLLLLGTGVLVLGIFLKRQTI